MILGGIGGLGSIDAQLGAGCAVLIPEEVQPEEVLGRRPRRTEELPPLPTVVTYADLVLPPLQIRGRATVLPPPLDLVAEADPSMIADIRLMIPPVRLTWLLRIEPNR